MSSWYGTLVPAEDLAGTTPNLSFFKVQGESDENLD